MLSVYFTTLASGYNIVNYSANNAHHARRRKSEMYVD